MLIIIAVLLRILSNPLANVFQKQLTLQNAHPLFVNFLTYTGLSVVCILIAFNTTSHHLPLNFWLYSVLGGIAGAMGNGFLVKALQKGDLSVLGPINSYKSVIGLITGIFFLREIPNIWGILGILFIIYGSYFVLDTKEEKFSLAFFRKPEIQFRIWAMILTAIEAVFVKKVILASSVFISFVSWCCFGALFSFLLTLVNKIDLKIQFRQLTHKNIQSFIFLIGCIGIMQLTTNYTFDNMPVGYALSLFQLSAIVSVVLGYTIFKEGNIQKKLIGSAIMVAGSAIIILLKNH